MFEVLFLLMINIYVQLKSSKDYYIHVLKISMLLRCLAYNFKKHSPISPKKAYQLLKETGDKPKFQIWTPPPRKKEMGESQKHTLSQIFIGIVHSA